MLSIIKQKRVIRQNSNNNNNNGDNNENDITSVQHFSLLSEISTFPVKSNNSQY